MTALLALLLLAAATPAAAHEGTEAAPSWTAALAVSFGAALILAAWIGRRARLRRGEAICVAAGFAFLASALVGPVPALEDRSLAAHMIAHELLMLAAAPLLVHARVWHLTIPALPFGMR
ncbi:MAG: cytochrome oxidase caa3-type, assembly factor CtaG-like protein, partial [Rhodospirillales bacterium]|nr:cytochrome oxidase caa3-type, assembly factor CtaG-like protein [Rhodospirillales bacterium]